LLVILGSLPVLALVLVVQRLVKLSVSLVIQVVNLRSVVGLPVERVARLRGLAHAIASGTEPLRGGGSFLVELLQFLLLFSNLLVVVVDPTANLMHAMDVDVATRVVFRVV